MNADAQVELEHGEQYKINIGKGHSLRTLAEIFIDGKNVLNIIMPAYKRKLTIERGSEDRGLFTFFASDSEESIAVGEVEIEDPKKGLIEVKFTPEIQNDFYEVGELTRGGHGGSMKMSAKGSLESMNRSGVTGLTGRSEVSYNEASFDNPDTTKAKTLRLRLILGNPNKPRPLKEVTAELSETPVPPMA